jgi:hypothetical protein
MTNDSSLVLLLLSLEERKEYLLGRSSVLSKVLLNNLVSVFLNKICDILCFGTIELLINHLLSRKEVLVIDSPTEHLFASSSREVIAFRAVNRDGLFDGE